MTSAIVVQPGQRGYCDRVGDQSVLSWPVLRERVGNLHPWLGGMVSVVMVASAVWQLHGFDHAALIGIVPRSPVFWSILLIACLATPLLDWMVFCRVWGRVPGAFSAVLRRTILNNAVLSYVGDAYLLAWTRERTIAPSRALATIRDVALLSAIVGGVVTLIVAVASRQAIMLPQAGLGTRVFGLSLAIIAVATTVTIVFAVRFMVLLRGEIIAAIALLLIRTLATTIAIVLLWHFALPDVPVMQWMTLAAVRLVFWRLPLVPNKDVAFAASASAVMGDHSSIATVIMLVAVLILIVQLGFALLLALQSLSIRRRAV